MRGHQWSGLIANHCSAADAQRLKHMPDGGDYKKLSVAKLPASFREADYAAKCGFLGRIPQSAFFGHNVK